MTLFNKLFNSLEESDQPGMVNGLVSPYSLPQIDITALAIDELETSSRSLGYIISNTYRKCSPGISLIKKIDPSGFIEFKSRIIDTLELNDILVDNDSLKEQLAEIFTWGYAECSKHDRFLVYSDKRTAEKIAIAIYNRCKEAGLKINQGKISRLLLNVLIAVLQKINVKSQDAKPTATPKQ